MPVPVTVEDLFGVVEKSRLVDGPVLGAYRSRIDAGSERPATLADRMVRDGLLTPFQAGLLLEGKTRPFFVGPFKVLGRIGSGSMGVVYLCEHVGLRRKVAVKVLQGRHSRDEVSVQRFLREARAAASLNHPNVVHALDVGREGDMHYLAMEYVEGSSLMDVVKAGGPIASNRLAGYLRQAAAGLEHAHQAGLIHRDIKPSNLMVGNDGIVRVLDLGLARFADCEENLTQGASLGSLGYIAPEQASDSHAVDHRADIYSLGATIFFGLTGHAPHPVKGVGSSLANLSIDDDDFPWLRMIIERMMAANPADRYQNAGEILEAIAQWETPEALVADADTIEEVAHGGTELAFTAMIASAVETAEIGAKFPEAPMDFTTAPASMPTPRRLAKPVRKSWKDRLKWPLGLCVAALIGYGMNALLADKRRPAPEPPKIIPKTVSPNSP